MTIGSFLLLIFGAEANAGWSTIHGDRPEIWRSGGLSVIIAVVQEAQVDSGPDDTIYRAVLAPQATLAGAFDPSLARTLHVRFHAGGYGTSIESPPKPGSRILAAIRIGMEYADEQSRSDWIVSSSVDFMPKQSALVVLDGPADPRIEETLKRIQAARAKSTMQQSDAAATQPTTQPGD